MVLHNVLIECCSIVKAMVALIYFAALSVDLCINYDTAYHENQQNVVSVFICL